MVLEAIDFYGMSVDDIKKYLPMTDCGKCGKCGCEVFAASLSKGVSKISECPVIDPKVKGSLEGVLSIKLEVREADERMEMVPEPLIPLNNPDADSPVILTGNSTITIWVLKMIFDKAPEISAWLLPSDSKGYTADHIKEMNVMTAMTVNKAILTSGIVSKVSNKMLIIPGLCDGIDTRKIESMVRWKIIVGPKSGFELPAYISQKAWE